MIMRTLYQNIMGNEVDLEMIISDLRVDGFTKEKIEEYMEQYVFDEGVLVYLYDLYRIINYL